MMNKSKLFVIVIFSLLVGSSIGVIAPTATARAVTKADVITNPQNGDTVSGTVTITMTGNAKLYIDGVYIARTSSYAWDTTAYADGSHTIRARYRRDSETITVTVDNGGSGGNEEPEVTITSPSNGATVVDTITIAVTVSDEDTLIPDIYIDGTYVTTASSYSWDTTTFAEGSHTIYAEATDSESLTGSDQITVTVNNEGTTPSGKYALLVGISDYKAISDLSYCDEDITDWYNYLVNSMGYSSANIIVLGDSRSYNYPQYDGIATEYNIKYYINWLVNLDCEEILFISSGHGGGDGNGESFNCAWDCGSGENGEDGYFYDYEYQAAFNGAIAPKAFIFMDHCYSGGLIPEFYAALGNKLYMTTTCTEDGYGYDVRTYSNGAWTYYFLEYTLINHFGSNPTTAMEDAFDYASANYPYGGGDTPMEGDYYAGDFLL